MIDHPALIEQVDDAGSHHEEMIRWLARLHEDDSARRIRDHLYALSEIFDVMTLEVAEGWEPLEERCNIR